jgi:uncharacterized circularly permuted ATP-grasp superfamily protein/uncharacterized alpha-E superfamily protein
MKLGRSEVRDDFASTWRYQPLPNFYDEMLAPDGTVRPPWRPLIDALNSIGPAGLGARWQEGRRLLHDNGVTYNVYGDPRSTDRPWPLDPIPFVIDENEWAAITDAIRQRATLLNAMLADFYGAQRLLRDGMFPPELVFRHPGFLRPCANVPIPRGIYLHNYSADLARSPDGRWWVIADRTQAPSGAGYALENRLVSQRVMPDVFRTMRVHRLAEYFQVNRGMLRSLVAHHRDNPRIVLLTPGPYNETYFEHALLARYLGYTLVEGADLTVRGNAVFLKTLGGLLPVDLIMRRQDDSFCDPLELRGDSVLGVPGLVQAVRMGNVAVTNALGSGLIESAAPAAFLPTLCQQLLSEELKMPTVATWWCGEEQQLTYVLDNLARLVIKRTFQGPNVQPVFGAKQSDQARKKLAEEIRRSPSEFAAQEQVALSTLPVWQDDRLAPRHLVLRVFVAAREGGYEVMPGGLTRMTSSLDSLVASMQHGGGSKDTWVLSSGPTAQTTLLTAPSVSLEVSRATFDLPSRVADNLFWLGRNVERVEATVRISRTILSRLYHESDPVSVAAIAASVRILIALGHLPPRPAKAANGASKEARDAALERDEILAMIYDTDGKSELGATLRQLRRLAWLLRDRFSADAWRSINRFDQKFTAPSRVEALRMGGALNLLDDAIVTLSAFGGFAMESMTRGHGWRFLDIGRRLERALQMVDTVQNGLSVRAADESAELQTLLEIADSALTYRSRYLTSMQASLVLDLLLLDEANPRSVAFQLERLIEHVAELPAREVASRKSAEWKTVMKMLTAMQIVEAADLARTDERGNWSNLENLLATIGNGLRALSETIARDYFDHSLASRQMSS